MCGTFPIKVTLLYSITVLPTTQFSHSSITSSLLGSDIFGCTFGSNTTYVFSPTHFNINSCIFLSESGDRHQPLTAHLHRVPVGLRTCRTSLNFSLCLFFVYTEVHRHTQGKANGDQVFRPVVLLQHKCEAYNNKIKRLL
jgi:hypothetical protein